MGRFLLSVRKNQSKLEKNLAQTKKLDSLIFYIQIDEMFGKFFAHY